MELIIANDYQDMSRRAAACVAELVQQKPDCVLGLATGSTPVGMYACLAEDCQGGKIDFSRVTSFNLDEYCGISGEHPQSFRYFMEKEFFQYVNMNPANAYLPNGAAEDISAELEQYTEQISKSGGIDLQVLGIGLNGHIGFNEPSETFSKEMVCVGLTQSTIQANSRFFSNIEEVPKHALSMGTEMIMKARRLLFLASGAEKSEIVYKALCGPITPHIPASVIQLHPNVTVIVDKDAARLL